MTLGQTTLHRARITRRDMLRRAGVAVVSLGATPALLAACGGSESAGPTTASTTPESGRTPESGTTDGGGIGGTIDFFSWEGYDLPVPSMTAWMASEGVEISSTYMANHDEVQAKLKAGASTGYDLVAYYDGYAEAYPHLGILHAIDETKVPNIEGMYPFFREGPTSDSFWVLDGTRWGVPFTWGSAPSNYRADLTEPIQSWYDLLEPRFAGQVGVADDPGAAFTLAGRILGHNPSGFTLDQFEEASELLVKVLKQVPNVAPGYGQLSSQLVAGDVIATYSGWQAIDVAAKEAGADVRSVFPKEGSFSFVDSYAIPHTADNVETALAFINQALTAETQAEQAATLSAGVVTPDALPRMDAVIRDLYPYDELEALFERAPLFLYPPLEGEEGVVTYPMWLERWEELKASA